MNTPQQHDPRLLAIDDSVMIHRLLKGRLKNERIEIHSATSGPQGLELARQLSPDIILLDIEMPDVDGFAVLAQLKADSRLHDIPVIILSGLSDTTDKVRALEMGAIDFVTKPFDLAELRARVRSALRIRTLINMLAQRAQIDGLTGLWNRAYFDQRLDQEVSTADRHGRPLSLIMCDIDHFKTVNDTHGHPYGDWVIEQLAHTLEQGRRGDIACRYGGEEFAIILPNTDAGEAQQVAERIRQTVQGITWSGRDEMTVTASFGVADLDCAEQRTPLGLVAAADQALYDAKHSGRNRVVKSGAAQRTVKLTA